MWAAAFPLTCLFQTLQDLKRKHWGILSFHHKNHTELTQWLNWQPNPNFFFFFSFSILSPFPTDSFHIVIFKGWETKSNACVFKPPTEGQVYVSDFMFMYILRTISDCCITLCHRKHRLHLFIFSKAGKLWCRRPHQCIYRLIPVL